MLVPDCTAKQRRTVHLNLEALETSFDLVAPRGDELMDVFYFRPRDLDAIVPKLRELGARRVAYGVEPEHSPVVGEVLLASLAEITGDSWTQEYHHAWAEAFAIVAGAMVDGAAEAQLEAAA
jgi:hypothetical protein